MTTHVKFPIGDKWICVEDGRLCVSERPDHVTFAVHEAEANGLPGARIAARFGVRRQKVIELALRLLELADRMTAETSCAYSQAVTVESQPPQLCDDGEENRDRVKRLSGDAPLKFGRNARAKPEYRRARMAVLHAGQHLLEHGDETAASLYLRIPAADLHGGLRVQLVVAQSGMAPLPDGGIAKH